MPLIKIAKPQKEPEFVLTNYDKVVLELIPLEQLKAANHDPHLLDLMLADEVRDADPERTLKDVYKGLQSKDPLRVLAATKNLTVKERNLIVKKLKNSLLLKTESLPDESIRQLLVLLEDDSMDLFDLCVRLQTKKLY